MKTLTLSDYQALAELRYQIRRFLHFSEQAARAAGLEPRQHQLMLALKGLPEGVRPAIRELAERMQIQHHSAVELVNRLAAGGYVRRGTGAATTGARCCWHSLPRVKKCCASCRCTTARSCGRAGPSLVTALRRAMQRSWSKQRCASEMLSAGTRRSIQKTACQNAMTDSDSELTAAELEYSRGLKNRCAPLDQRPCIRPRRRRTPAQFRHGADVVSCRRHRADRRR